ncbi:MAG TPA: long-chain fatty acid--CoA ligase [Chromatiaceae bacterium]|nr:long-chain fatty acid--CoA ligase [Chromatiaceae bacterium]HIO54128.1 long-chain fatty acid--CoA ligase [Chromatiales bacterium]
MANVLKQTVGGLSYRAQDNPWTDRSGSTPQDPSPSQLADTLGGLFLERIRRTPHQVAYRECVGSDSHWEDSTWQQMGNEVARWQHALLREGLVAGDRVAIMLRNCRAWVYLDQAALTLGLVVVPLYCSDRADNLAYICNDAEVRLILIEGDEHCRVLETVKAELSQVRRLVSLKRIDNPSDDRLVCAETWLGDDQPDLLLADVDPESLATIVYTSGTTGKPKGVMLSHHNVLWNAHAALQCVELGDDPVFLSFLPLSHTFERTIGYYLSMMGGATVAYSRSIAQLGEDLILIEPTAMVSVPRIFERVYAKIIAGLEKKPAFARRLFELTVSVGWQRFEYHQQRCRWSPSLLLWPVLKRLVADKVMARMGGHMRFAIAGGAALSPAIARTFIGLGLPVLQGYGLTETSPVLSVNRKYSNVPASVGEALPDVELRIGDNKELLARSPGVMMGYWNNRQATNDVIDEDGWLHTGDQAEIRSGHVHITGRLKEIIVLANGEKVPPADMEISICLDSWFEQVLVVGEGKPYLGALLVLNPEKLDEIGVTDVPEKLVQRLIPLLNSFPGYAKIRRVAVVDDPWTIENELLTPTLKLKRQRIIEHHQSLVDDLYSGHC